MTDTMKALAKTQPGIGLEYGVPQHGALDGQWRRPRF